MPIAWHSAGNRIRWEANGKAVWRPLPLNVVGEIWTQAR